MSKLTLQDAIDITSSYGPMGDDINEQFQMLILLRDEVLRLNKWADSATDSFLKERQTGEAYQCELKQQLSAITAERDTAQEWSKKWEELADSNHKVAVIAQNRADRAEAERDALKARIEEAEKHLPPIERDEHMDRTYIPIPGGYEIQTKGKGSTFRIAKVDGERYPIPLPEFVHEFLTQMALDIREAWQASAAQYSARIKELEEQLSTEIAISNERGQKIEQLFAELSASTYQKEQSQAKVAVLVEALEDAEKSVAYSSHEDSCGYRVCCDVASFMPHRKDCKLNNALFATTQIAEAYKRRIQAEARAEYRKELLSKMVDRFLSWKLPKNFSPDAGISFTPEYNKEYMASIGKPPMRHEPMGTNLFDADQAKSMVAVMLGGISDEQIDDAVDNLKASFNSELCNQAKEAELKDGE